MTDQSLFDQAFLALQRRRARARATEGADFLLRHVAEDLAERLAAVSRRFSVAVELHGHTGIVGERLLSSGSIDRLIRIETDPLLIGQSDGKVASLETVPLEPETADLIVSPLSLHLTQDTPGVLIQINRALKPDGLFLGAMPGAGTLGELREALIAAESELSGGAAPRVIPFPDIRDAGALMQRAGFALPVTDVDTLTVRYSDMFGLMRDLRAMGMANPLSGRSRRPASRALFLRAAELYAERFSDPDGRIRATFRIIHMSGWRPHESQQKPARRGSATVSLADILKSTSGEY
ncbi:methyltransferase domain-containing protein [Georhizobium profundi]|uniref:Methyltransferase domain-containing protein n=1 Tax=Georhizobium profundi TaxID=2341112 RepID=A0A3S9B8X0_9HYPH|nr:methyltransferase domain-containing protein [Georhizobium profundi]AZN73393.1 methyltransferase domain-containing protein [Georhizobium profundi]